MVRRVIATSGHMIDAVDRGVPRFPAGAERRVAAAIAALFDELGVGSDDHVITQGACGGDILMAEAAIHRGASSQVLLCRATDDYVESSVAFGGREWVDRFRAVLGVSDVIVQHDALGEPDSDENRYERNNAWTLDTAVERAATTDADVRAVVVWDRNEGKTGGTSHFVAEAGDRGLRVGVIDPSRAFPYVGKSSFDREPRDDGPKRLLALDGGGIRGLITLPILARMEELLGGGDPDYRLAHTFDYIAGTSTGAIIAAALAKGDSAANIEQMYKSLGPKIFKKKWLPLGWWRSLYRDGPVTDTLKAYFSPHGDGNDSMELGSPELESLFMAVMQRVDTDSIWPLCNMSTARYNDRGRKEDCNLDIPLWQILRGSSAAPIYFPPEQIVLSANNRPVFQDGGTTAFNNPAPLLFEMATSPRYKLGWKTGPDDLLIVSVGTGSAPAMDEPLLARKVNALFHARMIIKTIMNSSSTENDRLSRVLGHTRHAPQPLDREFDADDVKDVQPEHPLFTYVRYNTKIDQKSLDKLPAPGRSAGRFRFLDRLRKRGLDADEIGKLDNAKQRNMAHLTHIGEEAADQVELSHFAGFLP